MKRGWLLDAAARRHAVDLAHRLRDRIDADGPMTFRDWMEACLYDPDEGYYMGGGGGRQASDGHAAGAAGDRRNVRSDAGRRITGPNADADFATSPTLNPFMGQAIGAEIEAAWQQAGRPATWSVFEFGGGEGDLARAALDHLAEVPVTWTHIERSPTHREAQADPRVRWADALPEAFDGVVVAHEFLDALPFHVLERRKGNWAEARWDGRQETLAIPTPAAVDAAPLGVPDGQRVAAMADARAWTAAVGRRLRRGLVLVVDYGDDDVWRRSRDGTVRTFRGHQDAGSPYDEPGDKDITASVDFALLRRWGTAAGFVPDEPETQEAFLLRHGALDALNQTQRDTVEGASAYLRLRQMLLPTAMGGAFQVQRLWKR